MDERNRDKVAAALHTVLGGAVGYLSAVQPALLMVPAGLVVMAAAAAVSRRVLHAGSRAAVAGNIFIYLLVWLVAWTFFLNNPGWLLFK